MDLNTFNDLLKHFSPEYESLREGTGTSLCFMRNSYIIGQEIWTICKKISKLRHKGPFETPQ